MVNWLFALAFIGSHFIGVEEAATLFGILEGMGKEVYMAVYEHIGATPSPAAPKTSPLSSSTPPTPPTPPPSASAAQTASAPADEHTAP